LPVDRSLSAVSQLSRIVSIVGTGISHKECQNTPT
jgi:hypothetical protein